ncbi:helicase HerA-like domain-containing protein [Shewanella aestuarii]|uniref:DUF853 family protein n=1 Tax=Shewanella aestuarii TaxID=1028752 RepID=A0A6G9QP33_9GAMM|nr:helicase HerA-like domain-containing protein [Shewanella aestuarii]QIR16252.1 DUF853 family protein [Shewanella aestuarii]
MNNLVIGKGDTQVELLLRYGNRHGLIAGATGTGKTVSLMMLAENFSRLGVPVFVTDIKGDISGLAAAGTASEKLLARADKIGITDFSPQANPCIFWDLFGQQGHPIRTTVSEMGPTLLSKMLGLNATQSSILDIVFTLADSRGLLLLDLDDLKALLTLVAEERKIISAQYGLISAQSLAAIQRSLINLNRDGGDIFFGEPALELKDIMLTDAQGRGIMSILSADKLVLSPNLYASFMLWLLSELYENLPEVGDGAKPKLALFIDEAHLLFDDSPDHLLKRIEQIMRLIRSKEVGVYFCSQFPDDIPDAILGQLGNRIQHALRTFTPRDQKKVRAAAQTFVPNPKLDLNQVISSLAVGEALVSTLQDKGIPSMVEQTLIAPPRCRMGPLTLNERDNCRAQSPIGNHYDQLINRESAYERLNQINQAEAEAQSTASSAHSSDDDEQGNWFSEWLFGTKRRQGLVQTFSKQAARTVGNKLGKQIVRGILGSIMGKGGK